MELQTMAGALAATVLFILVLAYLAKRHKSKRLLDSISTACADVVLSLRRNSRRGSRDAELLRMQPDHPIYQQGNSVSFVRPGPESTPATPEGSTSGTPPSKPPEEARPPQARKPLDFAWYLALLKAAARGNRPDSVRVYLKRAAEDGHDWRQLYRELQVSRARHRWQPLPPEEQVDPSLLAPPKP